MHYPRHISVPYIVHLTEKAVLTIITGPLISTGMSETIVNLQHLLIVDVLALMELGLSMVQAADTPQWLAISHSTESDLMCELAAFVEPVAIDSPGPRCARRRRCQEEA
jgi:hypothetical protein